MDEDRVERNEDQVRRHRALIEAQSEEREDHDGPCHDDIENVQARTREPVHVETRVMDRVESPEDGNRVERAVNAVLGEIRAEQHGEELHDQRQSGDCLRATAGPRAP